MGMLSNQPFDETPPDELRRRVVVKLRPGAAPPDLANAAAEMSPAGAAAWNAVRSAHPALALEPYFSIPPGRGKELASRRAAGRAAVFARYFAVRVPAGADALAIARALNALPGVETAYEEAAPAPPPLNPADDPRSANQGYLDSAPAGIGARWAWDHADGTGVGFVDLEQGWILDHEDLAAAGITIISGVNYLYQSHGTAVLGEVAAVDNTLGGIGIAPGAATRVVSQWQMPGSASTAQAITDAADAMMAGDVLLLEAQTSYPGAGGYVPVEVEDAVFDAIQYAVALGIVVVEAAGNGSVDLDAFTTTDGRQILNRDSPDFRDSGAIVVGAASSAVPHTRMDFSNHGSRVDCYGWGENIDTCGGTANSYTTSFGGTSGASPIVTGAALLLQSWAVKRGKPRYTPGEMRNVLSDPSKNTSSANPAIDRIGVMPNLGRIMARRADRWRYFVLAWAWIIVVGALMITPGGVLCIKCGPGARGYLGDPVILVMGVATIALAIAGVARELAASREVAQQ